MSSRDPDDDAAAPDRASATRPERPAAPRRGDELTLTADATALQLVVRAVRGAVDAGTGELPAAAGLALDPSTCDATVAEAAARALPAAELLVPADADGVRRVGRYELGAELGRGGMGCVLEAWDPRLRRHVAVKLLIDTRRLDAQATARFVAEAQITSQLEHPSIVPVHDFGITDAATVYYVMKKVSGESLRDLLDALRRDAPGARAQWTRHRLLAAFVRICEAVAWAHERGVLHRDLKPANVMLGRFGEVLVLDWGVARLLEAAPTTGPGLDVGARLPTEHGALVGSPGFMSPEQILCGELDARSDQFSLGAILYQLLTWQPAFHAESLTGLLAQVTSAPPRPPHTLVAAASTAPEPVPEEISAVCMRALALAPQARFASVLELAAAVEAFLEGSQRRERGRAVVEAHRGLLQVAAGLRAEAAELRARSQVALEAVALHAPVEHKRPAWRLADRAAELERAAASAEVDFRLAMQLALGHAPELPEPHALLAAHHRALHEAAEARGARHEATLHEAMLRFHDRTGAHHGYLSGRGTLSLATDPTGACVRLETFVERDRRRVAQPVGELGCTPLDAVSLPIGSHLLRLSAAGHHEVVLPVEIRRDAPCALPAAPLALPPLGTLGADEVFVAAGEYLAGEGEGEAGDCEPRHRRQVEAFVIARYPVTNAEYLVFLDELVARGEEEAALRHAPRERAGVPGELGALLVGRDARGRFELRADSDGDEWLPSWPVVGIDWHAANAYAAWLAERTGQPWRLPGEHEWEKAARGVDGRTWPWGDFADPTWACTRHSQPRRAVAVPVEAFPLDCSVYGVRGMAGNVMDWCRDTVAPASAGDEAQAVLRGGAWPGTMAAARCARRVVLTQSFRSGYSGFRLARGA